MYNMIHHDSGKILIVFLLACWIGSLSVIASAAQPGVYSESLNSIYLDEYVLFDSFYPNEMSMSEIKKRLENFADAIEEQSDTRGYFIFYRDNGTSERDVLKKLKKSRKYLRDFEKLSTERLVIIDGGVRDKATFDFYIEPLDAPPPMPSPDQ